MEYRLSYEAYSCFIPLRPLAQNLLYTQHLLVHMIFI
nr:MAG TPA: hypothetical protein [Caudoviricetes sp.]